MPDPTDRTADKTGAGPSTVPATARTTVLGVERSLTDRRWLSSVTPATERLALAMSQQVGIDETVARVLAARGVGIDDAERFLEPKLRDLLPDPGTFRDMDRAAALVAACIQQGQQIAIFGDYDVDGATSSALLHRFIQACGGTARFYIPDRLREGYGPNLPALQKLHRDGAELIVTVDCGISAFDVLDTAAAENIRVVVLDHHLAEDRLPKVEAVVNPNRLDCTSGQGHLAAVGVAFMLAVAVNRDLRAAGWFNDRQAPNLLDLLDLVALGTVCDVVPLTGLNRAFVAQGLKVMAGRRHLGMTRLSDVANVNGPPGTYHAGFLLGPRVNAGGRVGQADLGARLLTTSDEQEAVSIAIELDRLNGERQKIEAAVLEEALGLVEAQANRAVSIVSGDRWHAGVIGIVASRLKDRTGRPAFVVALDRDADGNLVGKGSGRSIRGVDLGAAVTAARQAGLLINGGGHAMAAGITIAAERLDEFTEFLEARLESAVARAAAERSLTIDSVAAVGGLRLDLARTLEQAGPYGAGNPEPRLAVADAIITGAKVIGKDSDHLRVTLKGRSGGSATAMAFRCMDGPLGPSLLSMAEHGGRAHLAGHLRLNHWQGDTRAQFIIDDAARAET